MHLRALLTVDCIATLATELGDDSNDDDDDADSCDYDADARALNQSEQNGLS